MDQGLDPFQIFTKLRERFPQAFFFQSCTTAGHLPEVTVLGLEADEILIIRGGHAEVRTHQGLRKVDGNPLQALNERLQFYQSSKDSKIPYEKGGAFGAIGYDVVREIEPRLKKSGYFALLNHANAEVEAEIHFVKNLVVFDHRQKQVHVILKSQFGDATEKKSYIDSVLENSKEFSSQKQSPQSPPASFGHQPLQASLGPEVFRTAVLKLKEHIGQGNIFQAVLAERFECKIASSAFAIFECLRSLSPAAYSFYFKFSSSEFFGASPETLVKAKDGRVETHPIAGTRPRGSTEAEDLRFEKQLVQSVKEGAEHLMLVDLARNDIGRVSKPGTVEVKSFREIMRLSNVMHLLSKVEGQLAPGRSDLEALKACFPAGTLSGAPKIRAMEILSELEATPRGFYGGAMVAFDFTGGLDSCIAIRAMEVKGERAILRAGAGVVADSDPASEYQEILHKLATLRRALTLAESRFEAAL